MRALKLIIVVVAVLALAAIAGVGYLFFVRPATLPVYHMDQIPEGSNFTATRLMIGDTTYISGRAEQQLEITAPVLGKNWMIGRTEDGMEVYAIPGQDDQDYIMLTTLMFPQMVFRKTQLAPVALDSFPCTELQLRDDLASAPLQVTRDPAIIREAADRMASHAGAITGGQAPRVMFLRLLSEQLPGLGYGLYAFADAGRNVYMASPLAPEDWISAGPLFTDWFWQAQ